MLARVVRAHQGFYQPRVRVRWGISGSGSGRGGDSRGLGLGLRAEVARDRHGGGERRCRGGWLVLRLLEDLRLSLRLGLSAAGARDRRPRGRRDGLFLRPISGRAIRRPRI